MTITLETIPPLLVANIISKTSGLSFKNASLASRFINEITEKYRKKIKIWLPGYQIRLEEFEQLDMDSANYLQLYIGNWKAKSGSSRFIFICKPGEVIAERPELPMFVFEMMIINHSVKAVILQELLSVQMICCELYYLESDEFLNQAIQVVKPKKLTLREIHDKMPSDIINLELLKSLSSLKIYVNTHKQYINVIDKMTPHLHTLEIVPIQLYEVLPTLEILKNLVYKKLDGNNEIATEFFMTSCPWYPSIPLDELVKPFLEFPGTWKIGTWKIVEERPSYDENIFYFFQLANGSTLVLYYEKDQVLAYGVASNMDQFWNFFTMCRDTDLPVDIVFDTRKKRRQLNYIQKKYFP